MVEWIITYFRDIDVKYEPNINSKNVCKLEKNSLIIELEIVHNNDGYWIKHDKGWSLISNRNGIYFIIKKERIIKMQRDNKLMKTIDKIMKTLNY